MPIVVRSAGITAEEKTLFDAELSTRVHSQPPRLSGGVPAPIKRVVTQRELKLHESHEAQAVAAPGCPLCEVPGYKHHDSPLIGKKHVFVSDVPEEIKAGVPQGRSFPGRTRLVSVTVKAEGYGERQFYLAEVPHDQAHLVRYLAWKICPPVRTMLKDYVIPPELKSHVRHWNTFLRKKLAGYGLL